MEEDEYLSPVIVIVPETAIAVAPTIPCTPMELLDIVKGPVVIPTKTPFVIPSILP